MANEYDNTLIADMRWRMASKDERDHHIVYAGCVVPVSAGDLLRFSKSAETDIDYE